MHEASSVFQARAASRRRWKGLLLLSTAALLLHVAALSGLQWAWPARESLASPVVAVDTVQSRATNVTPFAEAPLAIELHPARVPSVPPAPARANPVALRAPAPAAVALPPVGAASDRWAAETPAAALQLALNTPSPPSAATEPAAVAAAGDEPIPHYRTRMPPPITLRFEMHRGFLSGVGDLSWRPQGDHYELKFEASVGGLPVLTQASAGGFDSEGVAPDRFTDRRLRRGTAAANFQRAAGKITFSGPSTEFALRGGAQDRLSWMVQLAAIVAADPQLSVTGAKVAMYVVGSNGDAGVWVFRCMGAESVPTGAGEVQAIKFVREPRETYDTTVQVWLDPHQHDLPIRALQKSGPNDEAFDLRLREVISAN